MMSANPTPASGVSCGSMRVAAVYATVPPRVEYLLTPLGRTLLEPVTALARWAQRRGREIQRARDLFDARPAKEERRPPVA
jgi:DNA-binding HxlR family transcriptional regulator